MFSLTLSAYNSPFLKCGRLIHCSLWLRLHDDESKTTRLCHRHPHVKGIRRFREYSLRPEFSNISVLGRMRVAEPPKTDRNVNVSQISVLVWTQPMCWQQCVAQHTFLPAGGRAISPSGCQVHRKPETRSEVQTSMAE